MDPIFTNYPVGNAHVHIIGNSIKNIRYKHYRYGNGMIVNADDLFIAFNEVDGVDRTCMKPIDNPKSNIFVIGTRLTNCDWQGINPQAGKNLIIENNIIENTGNAGILVAGKHARPIENVLISSNHISNTGIGAKPAAYEGISVIRYVDNIKIVSNVIESTKRFGIRLYSPVNVTIENNQIRAVLNDGIAFAGNLHNFSRQVVVRGNTIVDPGGAGIKIRDPSDWVYLEGNTIINPVKEGIARQDPCAHTSEPKLCTFESSESVKFIGNSVSSAGQGGIVNSNKSGAWVANNLVDGASTCYVLIDPVFINNIGKNCIYKNISGTADESLQ